MRAVRITETGGPEVLAVSDGPEPVAQDGELLVDVAVAGVNFIDTYHRKGAANRSIWGLEGMPKPDALVPAAYPEQERLT